MAATCYTGLRYFSTGELILRGPVMFPAGRSRNAGWLSRSAAGSALRRLAIALFMVTLCGALAPNTPRRAQRLSPARAALVQALGGAELSEGRLTGVPPAPNDRSMVRQDHSALRRAARVVREQASTGSAEALADLSLLSLALRDPDTAVATLQKARAKAPSSAFIAGELAAALLERASQEARPSDLVEALATIEEAVALQADSPELLFNRALALERLCATRQAIEAWQAYLALDATSPWAQEANERLDGMRKVLHQHRARDLAAELRGAVRLGEEHFREIVRRRMREARQLVEDDLLVAFVDSHQPGGRDTNEDVPMIVRRFAASYADLTGDAFYREVIEHAEAALEGTPHQARIGDLTRGFERYAAARRALAAAEYRRARELLNDAYLSLTRAASPFAWRVHQALSTPEHYLGERAQARRRLDLVSRNADQLGFLTLQADALWMTGLSYFADDQLGIALESYRAAATLYERLGDRENLMGTLNLVSETLDRQGEFEAAWRPRLEALQLSREAHDPLRLYQLWAVAAIGANDHGYTRAAVVFQSETIRYARRLGNPLAIGNSLLWRARYRSRLGDSALALADLREAERATRAIPDPETSAGATAAVLLTAAEIHAAKAPIEALDFLERAERLARSTGETYHLSAIYLLRSKVARARRDSRGAVLALERGIDLLKRRQTADLGEEATRKALLLRELYDELAAIHLEDLNDRWGAFRWIEERRIAEGALARNRPLRNVRVRSGIQVALADRLGHGQALVSIAPVGSRVLVTALSRSKSVSVAIELDSARLGSSIFRFRDLVQENGLGPELHRVAQMFERVLLHPVASVLEGKSKLALVMDPPLSHLSFSLVKDAAGRLLVEKYDIEHLSAAATLLDDDVKSTHSGESVSALFVGASVPDRRIHPGLVVLPEAEREARLCALRYGRQQVLTGARATKRNLLSAVDRHDVVQISAHGLSGTDLRRWGQLVLAPGEAAGSTLNAAEVRAMSLPLRPLVILAICGSDRRARTAEAAGHSLAVAFAAAGASAVIYPLWPLLDDETTPFLLSLHEHLRRQAFPATALALAQRESLASGMSPRVWAAFIVVSNNARADERS